MKKASEILKEMGFRENAPQGSQEAFFKYLVKSIPEKKEQPINISNCENKIPEQLSFDFEKSETKDSA